MLRIAVRYANQVLHFPPPAGPDGEVTLGASSENDLVTPFPGISRRHARLERREGELWIADLGSKNGLLKGEQRYGELLLRLGEKLQIGKAVLQLEEVASSDAEIALELPPTRRRRRRFSSLRLEPLGLCRGARSRLAAALRSNAGLAQQFDEPFPRRFSILCLRSKFARIDDEHAVGRHARAGDGLQPLAYLGVECS